MEENKLLRKENKDLKERLTKIELAQLGINVIISGMQEQRWESYSTTKDRVYDTITAAMGRDDLEATLLEAKKIEISCYNRIGPLPIKPSRPISVTFQNREDTIHLIQSKKNLLKGVYVNEEYPVSMKRNRDILRLILRLAKTFPDFREKSKLQGDKLVVNVISYTVDDLTQLPPELVAYKAAQKSDANTLVFHGKLSACSNFHNAPFIYDGQHYPMAKHYIQFSKAMFFGDTHIANAILKAETLYEA